MCAKKWVLKEYDSEKASALSSSLGIRPLTAALLCLRGITDIDEARSFLSSDDDSDCYGDPYLLKDMDKAVARIKRAKEAGESVCVYGDYDVDGVTSTTVLYKYLKSIGIKCGYFIPERLTDGYGLNPKAVEMLSKDYSLIITVDTGVTAITETELAKSLGVDIVITDHHSCRETLPDAVAVVNPQRSDNEYPFCSLAGVGVVFKLISAIEGSTERICKEYGDLIALGTIADVMPLTGENRAIVKAGLKLIAKGHNIGLTALMRSAGVIRPGRVRPINSSVLGFVLAPRLNAAGRIAKAEYAVELLLEEDIEKADILAERLCEINKSRQAADLEIFTEVKNQIEQQKENKIYVFGSSQWHQGVIGVVASKVAEKYSRPCVLFSYDGETAKGSARSVKGFNIMDALKECSDILTEYGGHELAAGLSLDKSNVDEFRRRINEFAEGLLPDEPVSTLDIDCECNFCDISVDSIREIQRLEPFGHENPQPVLLLRSVYIHSAVPVGNGMHVRMKLSPSAAGSETITAMCFGMPFENFGFSAGDICDVVFGVDINEYCGTTSAQLIVKDIKHAYKAERDNSVGESFTSTESLPTLNDFRIFYKYLRARAKGGEAEIPSLKEKMGSICPGGGKASLKVMVDVLEEQRLIECRRSSTRGTFKIKLLPYSGKVNLEKSKILCSLRKSAQS